MDKSPGFSLQRTNGLTIHRLQIPIADVSTVAQTLGLPSAPRLHSDSGVQVIPTGAAGWLFIDEGDSNSARIGELKQSPANHLHSFDDLSHGLACFELSGPAARTVLAMGCGLDLHAEALPPMECRQTRFAHIHLLLACLELERFHLFVDRCYSRYLLEWFRQAGKDPMTQSG